MKARRELRIIKSTVLISIVLLEFREAGKSIFGPLGIFPELTVKGLVYV